MVAQSDAILSPMGRVLHSPVNYMRLIRGPAAKPLFLGMRFGAVRKA